MRQIPFAAKQESVIYSVKWEEMDEAITKDALTSATVKDDMADTLGYAIKMLSRWVTV